MSTLWKTELAGENPALVESLERVVARVVPNPTTAHWGMRGGFVQLRPDSTLALQLAGNDLSINGYAEDLTRDDIKSLLTRLADALVSSFPSVSTSHIARLRRLGQEGEPEEEPVPPTPTSNPTKSDSEATSTHATTDAALTELVLELVTLARGLNTRLESLETRVDALESREDVQETLARAERLAQALRRS